MPNRLPSKRQTTKPLARNTSYSFYRCRKDTARFGAQRISFRNVLAARDRPTAVFASNDLGALAVLDVTDSLGLRIPRDISIVGFDNVTWAGLTRIGLTTIAQPYEELARLGVEIVLTRIEGSTSPPQHVTVPAQLISRTSTSAPSKR